MPVYDSFMRRDDIHRTSAGPGLPKWGWYNVRVPRWLQWKLQWAKLREKELERQWLERLRREP